MKIIQGDIFESTAPILTNPVNTQGTMGAGLALQFKEKFPQNFKTYKAWCDNGILVVGKPLFFKENNIVICNFPTKRYWSKPSELYWIIQGMHNLVQQLNKANHIKDKRIAMPLLGCGLGGLDKNDVLAIMDLAQLATPWEFEVYVTK